MNLALVDWIIVVALFGVMLSGVFVARRHSRSVVDFLAAGRTAGRYMISISQGMAALGAITIIGILEMNYVAGFSMSWWGMTMGVVILIVTVSGWVIYRFRQTRALTLAQFFERRYSRRFRIFAGVLAFGAGLINFGIFPAVVARFFIHFCGIPEEFTFVGLTISSFPVTMIVLLSIALFFVFSGGQVAVIITDFIQGVFVNVVFVVVVLFLLSKVGWPQIFQALGEAPEQASLINPFKTSHVEDFNFWYFLIGVIGIFYGALSWQGTQGYNASAKDAHEAKMGSVLSNWRGYPQGLLVLFVPIVAYTVMHHADFAVQAQAVNEGLAGLESEAIQSQLRTPLVLVELLPVGLMGAFAAVMLAAFISTHDTYLHSWGSIFIQDVVMPFRKKPLAEKEHLRLLRYSIFGVAVFIFCFSMIYRQSQYIFLFFAITGAIFAGGSGAVIIGGLYWKRGTAAAAWSALLSGSMIAVGGIIIHQIDESFFLKAREYLQSRDQLNPVLRFLIGVLEWLHGINGQQYWALAMGVSSALYVGVSLLGKRRVYDLDKLLNRGKYAIAKESPVAQKAPSRGWKMLGVGAEFTRGDKVIYIATYCSTGFWTLVFIAGTYYNIRYPGKVTDSHWVNFWRYFLWYQVTVSVVVVIWFTIGGFKDLRDMLSRLSTMKREASDDGFVRDGEEDA
jgi:SSS family solute:Na+ symporter